jgi:hypothetical protein
MPRQWNFHIPRSGWKTSAGGDQRWSGLRVGAEKKECADNIARAFLGSWNLTL